MLVSESSISMLHIWWMLTFTGAVVRPRAYYGMGSGYIMLTYVGCTGEERNLLDCTYTGYEVTSCSHSEDAGVSCPGKITPLSWWLGVVPTKLDTKAMAIWMLVSCSQQLIHLYFSTAPILNPVNCTNGDLRLSGGITSQQGRVEMCYERQWGTVCDDYWGTNDAQVACRQLGFSSFGTSYVITEYKFTIIIHKSVMQE